MRRPWDSLAYLLRLPPIQNSASPQRNFRDFYSLPVREWYYNAIRMLLLYFAPLGGGRNLRFSMS